MRRSFPRLKDPLLLLELLARHHAPRTVTDVGDEPSLFAYGTRIPVNRSAVPEDEVASVGLDLDLRTTVLAIPLGVLEREVVAVLADA